MVVLVCFHRIFFETGINRDLKGRDLLACQREDLTG